MLFKKMRHRIVFAFGVVCVITSVAGIGWAQINLEQKPCTDQEGLQSQQMYQKMVQSQQLSQTMAHNQLTYQTKNQNANKNSGSQGQQSSRSRGSGN